MTMQPGRMTMQSVGVVLPALNEGDLLHMTVSSLLEHADPTGPELKIVVVDDGSNDGCTEPVAALNDDRIQIVTGGGLGVARARNRGAAELDTDVLVFMDAHCTVRPGWLGPICETIEDPTIGMLGPAFTNLGKTEPRGCGMRWTGLDLEPCWFTAPDIDVPFEVPLTTGACQIFARDRFEALGRYDEAFTRWGYEDVEMCLRVWLAGLSVTVDPRVTVAHFFRESRDNYDIPEPGVLFNFLRLIYLHLSPTVIRNILAHYSDYEPLREAQKVLFETSIFEEREQFFSTRARDDVWFFNEVNGPLGAMDPDLQQAS